MEKVDLYKALSKFQGELPTIEKNKKAGSAKFAFKYADLSAILTAIRPIMASNGLSLLQPIVTEEGVTYLHTIIAHESGNCIESKVKVEHTGQNIQQLGSAITYYRRYALSSLLGIVSDDDVDDVASMSQTQHPYQKQEPQYISQDQVKYLQSIGSSDSLQKLLQATRVQALRQISSSTFNDCVQFLRQQQPQAVTNGVDHG